MKRLLAPLALAAAALGLLAAKPHPNWLTTVAVTPAGTHVLGNPDAPTKLVEYVSYTCPHCADFEIQADVPLRIGYIQPGKVSLEVRHVVRDPIDLTAAMLANCGDPSRFFRNHHELLAGQSRWLKRYEGMTDGVKARWSAGPIPARLRAIATDFGFYDIMARRGYQAPELDRCLSDEAKMRAIVAQRDAAAEAGVEGTPSFAINGALSADAHDWKSLETALKAAR